MGVDEVIIVYEGPIRDDVAGITRVRGCVVKDCAVGWCTVLGNAGSIFLEQGDPVYEPLKEAVLTTELEPESSTVATLRNSDRIEVLDWDKKIEASGVVRIYVKAKGSDGADVVGWVTKMDQYGE